MVKRKLCILQSNVSTTITEPCKGSNEIKPPNILITGTPGVGKSVTSTLVADRIGLRYLNVGDIVKTQGFHDGVDNEFDSLILDEERLCDFLETVMNTGGNVVDFHSPEIFPERWFNLILVLRTNTDVLFDRLSARGYSAAKRTENMECEIMQIVLDAAKESYDENIVQVLESNTLDDMSSNVARVIEWYESWKVQNNQH